MNQFLIFRFIQFRFHRACAAIVVAFVLLLTIPPARGQDNVTAFDAAATDQPKFPGNWQAPDTTKPPNQMAPTTWPNKKVSFDAQIKQSKFDATGSAGGSLESAIDSTGAALSRIKDSVASKASGLFGSSSEKAGRKGGPNIPRMMGSLALVLGGYFSFVWLMRKISPSSNSQLPAEVVQILGRTPFGSRQNLQLVRLGSKLVLLMNGPEGTHPIGEITEASEVQHLVSLCAPKQNITSNLFSRPTAPRPNRQNDFSAGDGSTSQGLANVLRSLEKVARQNGGSVFEA